ncbi:TPA: hypothetical protein SBJ50_002774 [Yersinia enterocolitica]|nr:hypothetical protein [Yersinia enterocolitica]HDL8447550.1 hypothetical protein [Yersinia enterocolitica]HEF8855965.1 hypothetical protein [Yersinia enterocolitica]HEN3228369.1 hypothetical protein [Yersinia enterocolitica]HEN3381704.1 hypothetical protein [Yersinia enterocolitica]
MKSNREAKRLLGMFTNDAQRISNRGWLVFGANYPHIWVHRKPSASQNRTRKRLIKLDMKKFMEELDAAFPLPKMGVTTDE